MSHSSRYNSCDENDDVYSLGSSFSRMKVNQGSMRYERTVYRVEKESTLQSDGIKAKNQDAEKSVISHVNCGSNENYKSQYISTTESKEVAEEWKSKTPGSVIVVIDLEKDLPKDSKVIDLTKEEIRDQHLKNSDRIKNYAKKSEEILIENKEGSISFKKSN